MPNYVKWLGFGFVAFLIFVIGIMVGAIISETYFSNTGSADIWTKWQVMLGTIGVLAAIGIAIYTDIRVDDRFEKQITKQIELDANADNRQQAEWNRQDRAKEMERQHFQDTCSIEIIRELQLIARNIVEFKVSVDRASEHGEIHLDRKFRAKRPFFDSLRERLSELPTGIIKAVVLHDTKFTEIEGRLQYYLKMGTDNQKVSDIANELHFCCGEFLADLDPEVGGELNALIVAGAPLPT